MRSTIHRIMLVTAACAGLVSCASGPSAAIPVFARKYGFNCTMCHSNYPRLNDFGYRYRQNGYQLMGMESRERTVLESPPPFAARITGGLVMDQFKNTVDPSTGNEVPSVNEFQLSSLDLLSGGLMATNIGYFMVYPPQINPSRGVAGQQGTLEMGNLIFSNISGTWLNVRAGRFEPAYTAFSVKRRLSFSPYEIYDFTTGSGSNFADTQTGVELTGYGGEGWQYAAGWLNGTGNNNAGNVTNDGDAPLDFYFRGVKTFGRGEGQTTGQRIGVTTYVGSARPPAGKRVYYNRLAADASINLGCWNLDLQYLWGEDNKALTTTGSSLSYRGGFVEFNYMPATDFVGFVRYDWVNSPNIAALEISDISRWTVGGRYYFVDNVALHLEYSHRTQSTFTPGLGDATENYFITALDFAF